MDLYDIWLNLNRIVNRQIKIKAEFHGPATIGIYINDKIYGYIFSFDGQNKKITFIDGNNSSFEDDGKCIVEKIKLTLPLSSL